MLKRNVIIIGAAGRDFHNFNTYFRDNELYDVVAFTAAQIPDIDGRKYPAVILLSETLDTENQVKSYSYKLTF